MRSLEDDWFWSCIWNWQLFVLYLTLEAGPRRHRRFMHLLLGLYGALDLHHLIDLTRQGAEAVDKRKF